MLRLWLHTKTAKIAHLLLRTWWPLIKAISTTKTLNAKLFLKLISISSTTIPIDTILIPGGYTILLQKTTSHIHCFVVIWIHWLKLRNIAIFQVKCRSTLISSSCGRFWRLKQTALHSHPCKIWRFFSFNHIVAKFWLLS